MLQKFYVFFKLYSLFLVFLLLTVVTTIVEIVCYLGMKVTYRIIKFKCVKRGRVLYIIHLWFDITSFEQSIWYTDSLDYITGGRLYVYYPDLKEKRDKGESVLNRLYKDWETELNKK